MTAHRPPASADITQREVILDVVVHGLPTPQGSKRVVRGRLIDANAPKLRPWRAAVTDACRQQLKDTPAATGPMHVDVTFTLPRPASRPKRDLWPDRKPDVDKLQRAFFDAVSDAGVWHDDAQVVEVTARKVYVGDPRGLVIPGVTATITRQVP